ncbi:sialate:O-sulfotransferase 1-like [Saccoglossus kowalevskii]|uniref:WSC domain-containing protein 1-like n=1 Tax=Saccoglossus kowalevskii TaxID=10224 RepID=A0ABM0GLA2_SACKO|nr:PREDICTED: WSC domain-containing protein 1-like [Saccoglossus kowalevskii]
MTMGVWYISSGYFNITQRKLFYITVCLLLYAAIQLVYEDHLEFREYRKSNFGNMPEIGIITKDQKPSCNIGFRNDTPENAPLVALSSFPGSGNTWTRHLLEVASGIYTGSFYHDAALYEQGFLGELGDFTSRRTIAVKIHHCRKKDFGAVILLIRNPYDAFISEYKRIASNRDHTGDVPIEFFHNNLQWRDFVLSSIEKWTRLVMAWHDLKVPILVVHYEELKRSAVIEVARMLIFLNRTVEPERLECVQQNLEGSFHRKAKKDFYFDPFTKEMRDSVDRNIRKVNELLINKGQKIVQQSSLHLEIR